MTADSAPNTTAQRIKAARINLGLSQSDLAKAAGVAPGQINRYEFGTNRPRDHILNKLAVALSVQVAWLAGVSDDERLPAKAGPNTERIAQVMRQMADDLRARASEIERCAQELIESGDMDAAVVAVNSAISTQNLPVGRLLSRLIAELHRSNAESSANL